MYFQYTAILFAFGILSSSVDAAPLLKRASDNSPSSCLTNGSGPGCNAYGIILAAIRRDDAVINNEGQPDVQGVADPEAPSPQSPPPPPGEIINNEGVPDVGPLQPGTPTPSIQQGNPADVIEPFVSTGIPSPDLSGPPINNEGQPDVQGVADPEAPSPPQQGPTPGEIINNEGQPDVQGLADPEAPSPPQQGPTPGEIINNEGVPDVGSLQPGTPVATDEQGTPGDTVDPFVVTDPGFPDPNVPVVDQGAQGDA